MSIEIPTWLVYVLALYLTLDSVMGIILTRKKTEILKHRVEASERLDESSKLILAEAKRRIES